jgi:predicted  nucleic acid-binding Zn-ribbon protein
MEVGIMSRRPAVPAEASAQLIDAIRTFPVERETEHCNHKFAVSPFDVYATCPDCGTRFKVRSFSSAAELEDVFDAVFEWMNDPAARAVADRRLAEIADDEVC